MNKETLTGIVFYRYSNNRQAGRGVYDYKTPDGKSKIQPFNNIGADAYRDDAITIAIDCNPRVPFVEINLQMLEELKELGFIKQD